MLPLLFVVVRYLLSSSLFAAGLVFVVEHCSPFVVCLTCCTSLFVVCCRYVCSLLFVVRWCSFGVRCCLLLCVVCLCVKCSLLLVVCCSLLLVVCHL